MNANSGSLNLALQDVPAGDDYYLLFINSTHGGMHAISPRFTILSAGSTANASDAAEAAVGTATTLSISGGPNPTAVFLTTFSAIAGSAPPKLLSGLGGGVLGLMLTATVGVVGAVCVLL